MGLFRITATALAFATPIASATAGTPLAPGLELSQLSCVVRGRELKFQELKLEPGHGLELQSIGNPQAQPNPRCRDGYGGADLPTLLDDPDRIRGFDILAATNGTIFRETGHRYASNSLLWSSGSGLLAPLREKGGARLFFADAHGGHEAILSFQKRGEARARLLWQGQHSLTRERYDSQALIVALQKKFPTLTLAVQSNLPLMDGKIRRGRFTHYTACPAGNASDWRCVSAARTVLCARADWSISLFTTPSAYPLDLAEGLRTGGACHAGCELLYNLDGGGSTQLAYRDPTDASYRFSGRKMETAQEGCSPYRPVDNYLVIASPHNVRNARARDAHDTR